MPPLFNVFSDPVLRARQDKLDAQWRAVWSAYQGCQNTPDGAFSEFVTDHKNWTIFYESGSDWSADSKKATDDWQSTLQNWTNRLSTWGCYGTLGGSDLGPGSGGVPTIKDPPPDTPGVLDKLKNDIEKPFHEAWSALETVGWVVAGLIALVVIGIVYIVTKGKFEGYGAKVG